MAPGKMYAFDADARRLTEMVMDLLEELAALDPAPLNGTVLPSEVATRARKLINAEGNDPRVVLDLFTSVLAPAVIRADSPRFLAWIPSAPTKASMLFDAVVSLGSISGVSWIESSGAVWAENEALRFIADLAGLPVTAGGTFVQGGSAANLSALAVARDAGRRRLGDDRRRLQFAVTDDTHSSVRNTMHLLDVDPLPVPLVRDRLTGDALAATLEACDDPSVVCGVVANAGSTNAGLVDDLDGVGRVCDAPRALDARRRRVRWGRAPRRVDPTRVRGYRALRLTRRRSAQMVVRAARLRRTPVPRP